MVIELPESASLFFQHWNCRSLQQCSGFVFGEVGDVLGIWTQVLILCIPSALTYWAVSTGLPSLTQFLKLYSIKLFSYILYLQIPCQIYDLYLFYPVNFFLTFWPILFQFVCPYHWPPIVMFEDLKVFWTSLLHLLWLVFFFETLLSMEDCLDVIFSNLASLSSSFFMK